jgi:hypothetical protein
MEGKRQRGTAKRGEREEGGGERGGEEGGKGRGEGKFSHCSPILAIVYWQSCPDISDLHATIFLSCFACPIRAVLFRLSFSGCTFPAIFVLAVLL